MTLGDRFGDAFESGKYLLGTAAGATRRGIASGARATGRFFGAGANTVADATRFNYRRFKAHRAGKREAAFSDLEAQVRSELASTLGSAVAEMPIPDHLISLLNRWTQKQNRTRIANKLEHAIDEQYCVPAVFALAKTYANAGDFVSAVKNLRQLFELSLGVPVTNDIQQYGNRLFDTLPYNAIGRHFLDHGVQSQPATFSTRTYGVLDCLRIAEACMPTSKDVHTALAHHLAAGKRKDRRKAPEHAQMALMLGNTDNALTQLAEVSAPRMRNYVIINFDRVALDYKPFVDDMLRALYGKQREYTQEQNKEAYRVLHRTSHLLDCNPAPHFVKAVEALRKDGIGVELLTGYAADSVPYAQLWVFEQLGPFGARVVQTGDTEAYLRSSSALAYVDTNVPSLQKAGAVNMPPLYVGDAATPAGTTRTSLQNLERTLLLK